MGNCERKVIMREWERFERISPQIIRSSPEVKGNNIQSAIRLFNARLELSELLKHLPSGNHKIKVSLAYGVLNNALEYVLTGKIRRRRGLYSALLNITEESDIGFCKLCGNQKQGHFPSPNGRLWCSNGSHTEPYTPTE